MHNLKGFLIVAERVGNVRQMSYTASISTIHINIYSHTHVQKGLLCPTRCIIVLSGTPNSANILICVCLKIWVVKCLPSKSHRRINSLVALFRIGCFGFTILTIESPRAFLSQRNCFRINRFYFLLRRHGKVRFQLCSVNRFYLLPWSRGKRQERIHHWVNSRGNRRKAQEMV